MVQIGTFAPQGWRLELRGGRVTGVFSILAYVSAGQGVAVVSNPFTRVDIPNVVYRPFNTDTPPMSPMCATTGE